MDRPVAPQTIERGMPPPPSSSSSSAAAPPSSRSLRSRLPNVHLPGSSHSSTKPGGQSTAAFAAPLVPKDGDALLEGWLKKRGTRIPGHWSERYFVLKGDQLVYYLKPTDAVARGTYVLDRTCVVSEVKPYVTSYDKKKTLHAFRIVWPEAVELTEGHDQDATKRASGRQAQLPTQAAAAKPAASSTKGTDVVTVDRSFADVGMDPYVMTPYQPPPPSADKPPARDAATKIIRSSANVGDGSSSGSGAGSMRRLGSTGSSSSRGGSSTSTLATGGAMVAMAVGGLVVGAMTAGLGLVAPMVIVGVTAATGSGAAVYGAASSSHGGLKTKQVQLVLALDNHESAEEWRVAIEAQIRWSQAFPQGRAWMSMVGLNRGGTKGRGGGPHQGATAATKLEDVDRWTRSTRWRPWGVFNGVRVYELDHVGRGGAKPAAATTTKGGVASLLRGGAPQPLPCRKVQVAVRGTPLETFISLVSVPFRVLNGVVDSVVNVERLDDQSDVIHLKLKPLYFWPTWTAPREFCLVRYWRYDEDGTYIICYDSTTHRACPPAPGYVRGDMHAVYTISPKKPARGGVEVDAVPECLLTHILQVDPRGWVWHQCGYLDAFVMEMLCQVLDVRDLLETDRFMAVHVDRSDDAGGGGGKGKGKKGVGGGALATTAPKGSTVETYRPTIPPEMWGDVDATSFVVRGPNYATSKLKVPSEKAAFRLLAVDLFELPEATEDVAGHPNNRVQVALAKGDSPPFIFVVQLQIPGVEHQLGYVSYFAPPDMSMLEDDTPLARVLKPFFFGDDDGYRDLRFKLIPKIVEGNWVVRKSVGSTPAILGTKLKQTYHRGTNYFELDVNIASSSVAAGVVRLAAGYAKTLVVDLALVIQGEAEDELPERVVACWQIREMDLSVAKRLDG